MASQRSESQQAPGLGGRRRRPGVVVALFSLTLFLSAGRSEPWTDDFSNLLGALDLGR